GILGGTMIRMIERLRPRLHRLIPSIVTRSALGGICVGLLGLAAPPILGVGYGTTSYLLRGCGSLQLASVAFGAKAFGFMLAVAISTAISSRIAPLTLTEQQMIAEGYRERVERADPLGSLTAGDVMSKSIVTFAAETPIAQVVRATSEKRHSQYPVVSSDG